MERGAQGTTETVRIQITPGRVDGILALVLIEFVAIAILLVRGSAAALIGPWALYLASGAFLLLALRAALSTREGPWIAGALSMSLLCHAALLWWLVGARSGALGMG